MFTVSKEKFTYTPLPLNPKTYTDSRDRIYTRFATAYDGFMIAFPLWKKWLSSVLPYVKGRRLLEISFGPGYLLSRYPETMEIHGLDYNETMVLRAKRKMKKLNKKVSIRQGNVVELPYPDNSFHTMVNTMAFSGYPDGEKAMKEMLRVLKPQGRILLLDYDYPLDGNVFGYLMVKSIEKSGDIIKDIGREIEKQDAIYKRKTIGCFGSVQLFIITKR